MAASKRPDEQFYNLMSALADSCLDASDAEVEEWIQEDGDNTEEIRQVLLRAVERAKDEQ